MNIFKKINDKQNAEIELSIEPNELFYSLKKEKEYSYLRGVQEEVLKLWHQKREESHVLIKMNTGAGKTLIGLLILYSKLIESKQKSIFLCPDRQLVNQVHEQSKLYGIPTCIIDADNEFPEEFLNNKSILVTTVQRLFNGKNIFDKHRIEVGAIVIDDAHKCIEKIQESFTVRFAEDHEAYKELLKLSSDELKKQAIGSFEAIKSGQPDYYMKLPYWAWLDAKEKVMKIFSKCLSDQEVLFVWDLFHNNYDQYELYISSSKIEIVPQKCYVQNIRTYAKAKYKYALSATFENDVALMYDLDFSLYSIQNPIEPKHRKDYGQRLILSPKRYFKDFGEADLKKIIQHHLTDGQNILVLVPSFREAKNWESLGARIINENIEQELEKLKKSKSNFIVLANRYDGIDLGGDACNVLIIHEHPKYKFLKDRYLENILHQSNTNIIAQTIEQGMGRTVRSGTDFSVIYLFGKNILRFLRHKENFKYLNRHTKRQIEMGLDLLTQETIAPEKFAQVICETADFCLSQNEEWLRYYQNFMKDVDEHQNDEEKDTHLFIKELQQKAIVNFVNGKHGEAIKFAQEILRMDLSDSERAIYTLFCANMTYLSSKDLSNDLVIKARDYSRHMFEPFLAKQYLKKQPKTGNQYISALNFLHSYSTMNDAIDALNEMKFKLSFDPKNDANDFEEAWKMIGKMIGLYSIRPEKEKGEGPDNLWILSNGDCLIFEAKSEKEHKNLISKSDISQLLHSLSWFDEKYLNEGVDYLGVTVQYNKRKESDVVVNEQIRAFDATSMEKMQISVSRYISFLSNNKINDLSEEQIRAEFASYEFTSETFVSAYLKKIT